MSTSENRKSKFDRAEEIPRCFARLFWRLHANVFSTRPVDRSAFASTKGFVDMIFQVVNLDTGVTEPQRHKTPKAMLNGVPIACM